MTALPCPCGLPVAYETCCGRFHAGDEPQRAKTRMRSRHAAFVERDARYLLRTLHLDHPSKARGENVFMASIEKRSAELTQ